MDQVDKLSRLRLTKRNKRKLSLPVLLNQFHLNFDGDSQTSKLEAIAGSPVRQLQDEKSHSAPSSAEKLGRSHSLSSPGELELLKKSKQCTRRLTSTNKYEGHSPSLDIFRKCSRKLEVTPDVFSPSKSHKTAEQMEDNTQVKLSKLSSTLLSPIPVCDPWSSSTPDRFNYTCPTNINQKEIGSSEVKDCGNEAENNNDNPEISSQSTRPIQTSYDSSSSNYYKKEKRSFKERRKGIRRSGRGVPSNDQNCSSKDDDNFNLKTKPKDQECTENHLDAELGATNTKEDDCGGKGLMTILEFLTDPKNNQADPNKGKLNRLSLPLPMEASLSTSPGDGYRTPVDSIIDASQVDGSESKTKDNENFGTLERKKSRKLSPMLTPRRKGVQKMFPWPSTTDESVNLLDNDKTDKTEIGSFSKEGPFRGIRESKKNKRWSSIFPASDEDLRMDLLSQKLDFYSKNGLIRLHTSSINNKKYQVPSDEHLEKSWQCLVDSPELLSKQRRQQQSTIWELVTTEVTYLNTLKVIVDIFLSCLVNLQTDLLMVEIDVQMLFSNIQDIYVANLVLWHEHIIKMIEFSRSTGQPLDPTFLFDAFSKVDELLHPYTQYCLEQSTCQNYCRDKDFESIHFKTYLAWCETQRECNRLRLADILVTPMQRLTKYSLLIQAISKKTTEDDYKVLLDEMICSIDKFVCKVNNTLRYHHDQKMIWDISTRIEAYEVVESKDEELEKGVKVYSQLNLQQSMPGCPAHHQRSLLFHGDMKLRDAQTSKLDVHVFIFTDMLLITKCTQKKAEKLKIIRPPFHLSRLVVIDVKDVTSVGLIYINEWNLAEASFTLQCHSETLQKAWIRTLKQAQVHYKILQDSKDDIDDTYVSDLPMYARDFEGTNGIQSLPSNLTSLGTSPNVDSVCTSGFSSVIPSKDLGESPIRSLPSDLKRLGTSPNIDSVCTSEFLSVVPSKDLGASPNINSTNSSGISSIVNSNCVTADFSQYIFPNSSDKFTFLHSNDSCKAYSLGGTDEVDRIINNRKLDDCEFTSSMWIGYSSMPESPEHIHTDLDDLEDSGIVSGNVIRIPVKYSSKNSCLSPSTTKYPHSLEDRFLSMTNISSTPKSNYDNSDEKTIPRDEMKEEARGNTQEKTSENQQNEQKFCTRINVTLGKNVQGQTTDPNFPSESRLSYESNNLCISSTPGLDLNNNGYTIKNNESFSTSPSLFKKRLLERQNDFTEEGCLRTLINISPMKCGYSKTSNISTTYIYHDNQDTNITFGDCFSQYITDDNKQCMRPTKSDKEEYSCIIKIDGSEINSEVYSSKL